MKTIFQALLALMLTVQLAACRAEAGVASTADGTTTSYALSDFTSLQLGGIVHASVTQGTAFAITVEESPNPQVLTVVQREGSELHVYTKTQGRHVHMSDHDAPRVSITLPRLTALTATGATHIDLGNMTTGDLRLDLSGASKMTWDALATQNLDLQVSGASHLAFRQLRAANVEAQLSGASRLTGDRLEGQLVQMTCSGASKQTVAVASRELSVRNSGASDSNLTFAGERMSISNSGAGRIRLQVDCQHLEAHNSGAANFTIGGSADHTKIDVSGASRIDTSALNQY